MSDYCNQLYAHAMNLAHGPNKAAYQEAWSRYVYECRQQGRARRKAPKWRGTRRGRKGHGKTRRNK